jgi:[ribosomal protein S5]-alanine N-acetyltransferase
VQILETERLSLRELDKECDAAFTHELLNSPKFLKYVGDRGVRSAAEAADFIENRYAASYREHGYGLWAVDLTQNGTPVGICGFVRRETLPGPDIGFAFLPEFERQGYGSESARAVLDHGREVLGFTDVWAITSLDNDASGRLLEKLGFTFKETNESGPDTVKVFHTNLTN